jgi:hypothetical protein
VKQPGQFLFILILLGASACKNESSSDESGVSSAPSSAEVDYVQCVKNAGKNVAKATECKADLFTQCQQVTALGVDKTIILDCCKDVDFANLMHPGDEFRKDYPYKTPEECADALTKAK